MRRSLADIRRLGVEFDDTNVGPLLRQLVLLGVRLWSRTTHLFIELIDLVICHEVLLVDDGAGSRGLHRIKPRIEQLPPIASLQFLIISLLPLPAKLLVSQLLVQYAVILLVGCRSWPGSLIVFRLKLRPRHCLSLHKPRPSDLLLNQLEARVHLDVSAAAEQVWVLAELVLDQQLELVGGEAGGGWWRNPDPSSLCLLAFKLIRLLPQPFQIFILSFAVLLKLLCSRILLSLFTFRLQGHASFSVIRFR